MLSSRGGFEQSTPEVEGPREQRGLRREHSVPGAKLRCGGVLRMCGRVLAALGMLKKRKGSGRGAVRKGWHPGAVFIGVLSSVGCTFSLT